MFGVKPLSQYRGTWPKKGMMETITAKVAAITVPFQPRTLHCKIHRKTRNNPQAFHQKAVKVTEPPLPTPRLGRQSKPY